MNVRGGPPARYVCPPRFVGPSRRRRAHLDHSTFIPLSVTPSPSVRMKRGTALYPGVGYSPVLTISKTMPVRSPNDKRRPS